MPTFTMLSGLPGSGKSTYTKTLPEDTVICSSDAIRKELYGNENVQDNSGKAFRILTDRIYAALADGRNVCMDATNLHRKYRVRTIKKIREQFPEIHAQIIIFDTPLHTCLKRNAARSRVVPEEVIRKMQKTFQIPDKSEGWDDIIIINPEQPHPKNKH